MSMTYKRPERFNPDLHDVRNFRSGNSEVDVFLRQHAKIAIQSDTSVTHVISEKKPRGNAKRLRTAAYFSLATASVDLGDLPEDMQSMLPNYPVPSIILTWLGVDAGHQGQGLGGTALRAAGRFAVQCADTVGVHLMVTDAIDARAIAFYQHFGFQALPNNAHRLFMRIDALRKSLPDA